MRQQRAIATYVALPVLAVLLFVMGFVKVPFVVFSPGETVDVLGEHDGEPIVQVEGRPVYRDDGELRMTTVLRTSPEGRVGLFYALRGWLSPAQSVYQRSAIYPHQETNQQSRQESAVAMVSSQDAATANALRELGYTVAPVVEVLSVSPGMPAEGRLEVRDILLRVGSTRITGAQDVVTAVQGAPAGDPITFVVRRDGERERVQITPDVVDGTNRVGIVPGAGYQFPFEVTFNLDEGIGGPSAGLMFSLALYDTLTPGSLTGGNVIAGTGTISDDGEVGAIGGIQQKVVAAQDVGAELFLVPTENCRELEGVDHGDMRLVKATTMHDALQSVEEWVDDPSATLPSCDQ